MCNFFPQGLKYIHSMGLVHLDIKPDNLFISLPDEATVPTDGGDQPLFDGLKAQYKIGNAINELTNQQCRYK